MTVIPQFVSSSLDTIRKVDVIYKILVLKLKSMGFSFNLISLFLLESKVFHIQTTNLIFFLLHQVYRKAVVWGLL